MPSPPPPFTIAAIDIGTNTVLLLLASIDAQGAIVPLLEEQRVPRLGRGVDASGLLREDAIGRVVDALEEYAALLQPHQLHALAVFGTSAVRDAANRDELAARIMERTGFRLEVLTGEEEAVRAYRGAVSGVQGIARAAVIDIGGGSTEISWGAADRLESFRSLDIGSVRLTERFFHHDPPEQPELAQARDAIREVFDTVTPPSPGGSGLIAVAGTATTLALLAQNLRSFSVRAVSGFVLAHQQVAALAERLSRTGTADILALAEYMQGRSDIITAGAVILDEAMNRFGFTQVIVSERGVRYGVALREAEKLMAGRAL